MCKSSAEIALALRKTQADSIRNAFHSPEVFTELADVLQRLNAPTWLNEIIDFKDFFFLSYMQGPKMRATTIGFLQQTTVN
ncbi:MAG: hypothetical protein EXS58_05305 [Candidatus Latescibacteria bacterium]|nr:hypothetical protein [Candidatus Latescibacterota bacterium]